MLQGRYRIECVLGLGAFGRVYLAEDQQDMGDYLAIKELLDAHFTTPEDKEEAITWFKREVAVLLSLRHSGIPVIHAYWTAHRSAGPFYLAMDYIPGKTLEGVLQDAGGRVPWREVAQWGIALCDVLAYLHSQTPPFIFRDMKLQNVMLDSRKQSPALIDFGIARQLATAGGTAIGTWGYVPYEQIVGRAEPRSDVYALGATLHALLTGRQPDAEYTRLQRSGHDLEATLRALFPRADSIAPDVPAALADALVRATAYAASDRFPDAASLSAALAATLGRPAPPPAQHTTTAAPTPLAPPSPASTPPSPLAPAPPQIIVVAIKGAGQYTSIAAAVHHAPPGSRIEVRPGRYVGAVVIDKPVEIVGTGRVEDTIIENSYASTITVTADTARLQNLTVRNSAALKNAEFNALSIVQGRIEIEGCHFTADSLACVAVSKTAEPTLRSCIIRGGKQQGIVFANSSGGRLHECQISGNGKEGVVITDGSAPTLFKCRIHSNRGDGIYMTQRGEGTIESCDIFENARAGIRSDSHSTGVIDGSTIRSDGDAELFVTTSGKLTIRRCTILNSQSYGILLQSVAHCTLEDCKIAGHKLSGLAIQGCSPAIQRCTIHDNHEAGVVFHQHAGGRMEACNVHGNAEIQLLIQYESNPVIQDCTIHGGVGNGIVIQYKCQATIGGCEISNHAEAGIGISGAMPTVVNCSVHECQFGMLFALDSAGKVSDCDLYGNRSCNVGIQNNGNPLIVRTAARDSENAGVVVIGDGRGTLQNCRIVGNKGDGVVIGQQGNPTLRACQIANNGGFGVKVNEKATGAIEDCILTQNAQGSWSVPRFGKTRRINNKG